MTKTLTVDTVTVAYGRDRPVLHGVSVSVIPGQVLAVTGPSGAGKTTLLRLIAGLDKADEGAISFNGRELTHVAAWERGFATAFQDARLMPHLSVRENLLFARKRSREAPMFADIDPVIEALDLAPLLHRRVMGLSGGERQRVGLGRALLGSAQLLLLDEPTAMVDSVRRRAIAALVRETANRAAVLMASHLSDPIAAERSIRVENGAAKAEQAQQSAEATP